MQEEYERVYDLFRLGISGYKTKPLILTDVEKLIYQAVGVKQLPQPVKIKKKTVQQTSESARAAIHKLLNLLGIARNKCENFSLNIKEGFYKDKTHEELMGMSLGIMQDVQDTVDKAVLEIEHIKNEKSLR